MVDLQVELDHGNITERPQIYGNLIQLSGNSTARSTWRRVPVGSASGESSIDEAALQEILFRHADILPLGEIDPAYHSSVPVCVELGTRAGSADALYLTPTGRIVLAEFKLWRNPDARREVVGQILDYARVLASWSYDDLDREVRNRTKRSPFDIVSEAHGEVEEHSFVDGVARRLKRGEFLLLIIGDGIREGVQDIVAYVQEHSGLRFNLALIEAAVFRRGDSEDLIIQPRVLARTELVPRTILIRKTVLEETDDDPVVEHEASPIEDENERFWRAVLEDFAFDDPTPEVPQPSSYSTAWVKVEGSGFRGWGLSFGAFLNRNQSGIGTYLTWRAGFPEEGRVFDEIISAVDGNEPLAAVLDGCKRWTNSTGQPRLGFSRHTEFVDGTAIRDFEEAVEWMREHFNRLVTALHPECRRRLRQG
ncbi:hypothetical protein [Candidatus Palauibacter soopunensis]|uniref:hypothetical protein n=1 Tax=Candidatus Palauibacter soopunensis TaxID=3056739 RepID=UPI002872EFD4|nr:hypothetical protein [Candidatus Palauibacter soopunensis]